MPPAYVVHVGSTEGGLGVWRDWGVKAAVLVDTDTERLAAAHDRIGLATGQKVQAIEAVLAEKLGEATFYELSFTTESGLFSAEALKSLWPGVEDKETRDVKTVTLDGAVFEGGPPLDARNAWLLLDQFGAASVLQGGSSLLEKTNLVGVRMIADDAGISNSRLGDVTDVLEQHGFACIAIVPGNHPKIGYGVFVKDLVGANEKALELGKSELEKARQVSETHAKLLESEKSEVLALRQSLKEVAEAKAKSDQAAEAARKELEEVKKSKAELDKQLVDKVQEFQAISKELQDNKAGLEVAQKSLKEANEAKAKSDQAAEAARKELESVKKSQADLQKQMADKTEELKLFQSGIDALKAENVELNQRQQLMNEELVKAEAQIELIKDLVLRDQSSGNSESSA